MAAGITAIGSIDPADPRLDRADALKAAGAFLVAEDAGELAAAIRKFTPAEPAGASLEGMNLR